MALYHHTSICAFLYKIIFQHVPVRELCDIIINEFMTICRVIHSHPFIRLTLTEMYPSGHFHQVPCEYPKDDEWSCCGTLVCVPLFVSHSLCLEHRGKYYCSETGWNTDSEFEEEDEEDGDDKC